MKTLPQFLLVLLGITLLSVNAIDLEKKDAPREIAGWGTAIDPDGDCKFFVADETLLISVPGTQPHDLASDIETVNAPRVLQAVQGDFVVQVRVDGRFAPGGQSTKEGRTGYNGAAIVALADTNNVITLARAVLQMPGRKAMPYANFEIRVGGELLRIGTTGDHPLPKDGPVFLRLERRGSKFIGSVSTDGTTWDLLESKDVPAEWPEDLKAGVAAISTSKEEFNPKFSKLQVEK